MTNSPTLATSSQRGRTIGLHHGAKSLLRNVIRHTDTHNRLLEESEMWQQFYKMRGKNLQRDEPQNESRDSKRRRTSKNRDENQGFRDLDIQRSFLYDERQDMRWDGRSGRKGMKRAHMDDNSDGDDRSSNRMNGSTFWMRQLHKAEEGDPDRWGHAGFKELYPDVYDSDRSISGEENSKKVKRKRHREVSNSRKSQKLRKKMKKKKSKKDDSDRKKDSAKKQKRKEKRQSRDKRKEKSGKRKRDRSRSLSNSDGERNEAKSDNRLSWTNSSSEDSDSSGNFVTGSGSDSFSGKRKRRRNIKTENEREKRAAEKTSGHEVTHRKKKRRKHE